MTYGTTARRAVRTSVIGVTAAATIGAGLAVADTLSHPGSHTGRGSATANAAAEATATDRHVQQVAQPGVDEAAVDVRGSGTNTGTGTSTNTGTGTGTNTGTSTGADASPTRRICSDGAKWLRVRFDDLTLRAGDSITLTTTRGKDLTLTSRNWQGKSFYTRALEGECLSVTPRLHHTGSSYAISAYQAGQRPLAQVAVTVAAAGDICGTACNQTDDVVTRINPAALITAGDNAYDRGSSSDYRQKYEPHWGQFNKIVHPSAGNHEYKTSGASGYFGYYEAAGVPTGGRGKGYYSFDVGDWHLVALNSNISDSAGSAQGQWLKQDLAASTKPCTMAYWHHPRFSSGDHGDNSGSTDLYKILTDHKADVVVNGHDHHYERFAPATADGKKDEANGLREFVIGTGGRTLYSSTHASRGPSEVFNNKTFGVGEFNLSATGYKFAFRPVAGRTFTDSVEGTCHAKTRP